MIAIIPAWSGSNGLLNKAIKNLAGKPLIAYTIEAVKGSKSVDRIIVSTDSEEIGLVAKSYGAEVPFLHSANFAADGSSNNDAYLDTIDQLRKEGGLEINDFIILQPTSPLRSSEDIDKAIQLFRDKNSDSVISYYEVKPSGFLAKRIVNNVVVDYFNDLTQTGSLTLKDIALIPNGAISVFNYHRLKKNGVYLSDKTFPYIMPAERSVNIETLLDFEYAEFLIVKNNKNVSALDDIKSFKVFSGSTIRDSIKKLDETGIGFIVVVNQFDKVLGVVTDGDFRRAVLSGVLLDDPISSITNQDFIFVNDGYSREELERIFLKDIAQVPVIHNGELKEIILRKNLQIISNEAPVPRKLDIPVVIMAGGKGTRLEPFTHIMPKPLIPIGNKPIIEIIIERFAEFGINEFYLSLNYKANMIKAYFEGRPVSEFLQYIIEDLPLGTAGALKKLKDVIKSTFIVSNCDIIIKSDYTKIIDFHRAGKFELTLVACMHHYTIPYGVCYVENGGSLKEISEKPEFDYLVNTGMYVLEPEVLDVIPDNSFYHITELINDLKKNNRKVGVYPVYEKSWIDIGQWEEYKNAIKYFQ